MPEKPSKRQVELFKIATAGRQKCKLCSLNLDMKLLEWRREGLSFRQMAKRCNSETAKLGLDLKINHMNVRRHLSHRWRGFTGETWWGRYRRNYFWKPSRKRSIAPKP